MIPFIERHSKDKTTKPPQTSGAQGLGRGGRRGVDVTGRGQRALREGCGLSRASQGPQLGGAVALVSRDPHWGDRAQRSPC